MDEARKGQIAVKVVKHMLREKEVAQPRSNFYQEISNLSKEIGVSTDEIVEFVDPIMREVIDETFVKR
ncbi:MAG: hypothetical protein UW11_C0001G0026 [Parcubacteria group bacterium GW2011_GWA2_43_9b]|nr:MAG: hypothetical protein UW11_C0001G0026 [Parcubacteria group bacterium GW2011_GWA2_43_9b]